MDNKKLAERIYSEVDGADNRQHKADTVREIEDWLDNGDGEPATVEQLAEEWKQYQKDAEEA